MPPCVCALFVFDTRLGSQILVNVFTDSSDTGVLYM